MGTRTAIALLIFLNIREAGAVAAPPATLAVARYERRERHMGTDFAITLYAPTAAQAEAALAASRGTGRAGRK